MTNHLLYSFCINISSQQGFLSGRQDFPRRSATSCRIPLRRLRSLTLPSWQSFLKKSSKFSLFFRTVHSVSNPVCPQLIRFKIKKPCCFHNKVHIGQTGFEPATSWSQTRRATSCATARLMY